MSWLWPSRTRTRKNGWEERYVVGQLQALYVLSAAASPGPRGSVYVHEAEDRVGGFVSVEFRGGTASGNYTVLR